jgi:hypothetical protein
MNDEPQEAGLTKEQPAIPRNISWQQKLRDFCLRDVNTFSIKWISDHLKNYGIAAALIGLGTSLFRAHHLFPIAASIDYLLGWTLFLIGMIFGGLNFLQFGLLLTRGFRGRPSAEKQVARWIVFGVVLFVELLVATAAYRILLKKPSRDPKSQTSFLEHTYTGFRELRSPYGRPVNPHES